MDKMRGYVPNRAGNANACSLVKCHLTNYIKVLVECRKIDIAFNGFGIDFADGAGLSVNVTNGCPVKTSQSVAVSGTVNVKVLGAEGEYTGGTVVLARVPTANASALASAMVVGRVRGFKVSSPAVGAADGQGLSPISVNIEKQGLVIEIF